MHEDQGDDSARHTEQLSALTLLMYQAAQDPERWAEMTALLREAAIPFEDDRIYQQPNRRRRMLDALVPHVEQALRLGEQMERTRETRDLAVATLERLPIGIAVVDAQLNIITLNRIAAGALSDSEVLSNHQGRLRINNRRQHQALHEALARCLEQGSHHALPLTEPATGVTVSLLVCPSRTVDMEDPERPAATLFISHSNLDNLVDETLLGDLYDLTPAESKVAKGLVSGHTLDRIADDAQVAPATVRAQLKSVFRKTDTGRQAELVSVILSGLAPLAPRPAERAPAARASERRVLLPGAKTAAFDHVHDLVAPVDGVGIRTGEGAGGAHLAEREPRLAAMRACKREVVYRAGKAKLRAAENPA